MNERIYLDYNATAPIAPEVVAAMSPFLADAQGNPSSLHWAGLPARDAVEEARSTVAALLCCDATEVVFTSGGTEANNLAIKGVFFAPRAGRAPFHIVTSRIEHPSVLEPCAFLNSLGAEVTQIPVDRNGMVDPDDVRRAIRPHTALISIMHANNEVGTIQPISEIAAIARDHGVPCHTDAAQTVGKIPVDVESLGVDLLSVGGSRLSRSRGTTSRRAARDRPPATFSGSSHFRLFGSRAVCNRRGEAASPPTTVIRGKPPHFCQTPPVLGCRWICLRHQSSRDWWSVCDPIPVIEDSPGTASHAVRGPSYHARQG
jgi:cysteine desulfurase